MKQKIIIYQSKNVAICGVKCGMVLTLYEVNHKKKKKS